MRIIADDWENNIKELENRIIAKIWSIIISSLIPSLYSPAFFSHIVLCYYV